MSPALNFCKLRKTCSEVPKKNNITAYTQIYLQWSRIFSNSLSHGATGMARPPAPASGRQPEGPRCFRGGWGQGHRPPLQQWGRDRLAAPPPTTAGHWPPAATPPDQMPEPGLGPEARPLLAAVGRPALVLLAVAWPARGGGTTPRPTGHAGGCWGHGAWAVSTARRRASKGLLPMGALLPTPAPLVDEGLSTKSKSAHTRTHWPAAGRKACSSYPLSLKLEAGAGALWPCKPSKPLPRLWRLGAMLVHLRRSNSPWPKATQFTTLLSVAFVTAPLFAPTDFPVPFEFGSRLWRLHLPDWTCWEPGPSCWSQCSVALWGVWCLCGTRCLAWSMSTPSGLSVVLTRSLRLSLNDHCPTQPSTAQWSRRLEE